MKTTKFWTNFILGSTLLCAFTLKAQANTANIQNESTPSSIENVLDYVSTIFPADRRGFSYPMVLVGGHVRTELPMPLYVTIRIGGQSYTALTDKDGVYSFMVYSNGARQLTAEAWSSTGESSNTLSRDFLVEAAKP